METKLSGAAVSLSGVSKSYGPVQALDAVSLRVDAGEFVTLLGPSGSGKTTLLNIVAGFIAPDGGTIEIGGRSVVGIPPYRRGLGVVFQHYALFPHMTVFQNIAFPLRMRRKSAAQTSESVHRVLELVRLSDLSNRYPHQLSGGQQQRIAMARAIVFSPQVLLMDEPLGALDRNLREQLQFELRRLHRQLGVTVLYVTHDQQEALVMSNRIALMNRGRIAQLGTGKDLYERPNSEFVARFLGESNLLRGNVIDTDGAVARVSIDGLTVPVRTQHVSPRGGSVRIVIRPERIRLTTTTDATEAGFRARVQDVTYFGDYLRVIVLLDRGPVLAVKYPHPTLAIVEGGEVVVTWDPQDVLVLPSEDAGSARNGPLEEG